METRAGLAAWGQESPSSCFSSCVSGLSPSFGCSELGPRGRGAGVPHMPTGRKVPVELPAHRLLPPGACAGTANPVGTW